MADVADIDRSVRWWGRRSYRGGAILRTRPGVSSRRPVVAALERIGTSAVIAEHAVLHGNEAGVLLVLRHRLPRVLQALNAALQALIVTVGRPEVLPVAYAC